MFCNLGSIFKVGSESAQYSYDQSIGAALHGDPDSTKKLEPVKTSGSDFPVGSILDLFLKGRI